MEKCSIISIGDNVCDKYLSRGKMYPGGQCVNTCVYGQMNNIKTAYLGKYGDDAVAKCVQDTLKQLGIDDSRSRHFKGENGFALVTLKGNDRVFLGSNKGGIAKTKGFGFTQEDFKYIQGFGLIYTNLNSYIESDIARLASLGVPVAYDFSTRWTDTYLEEICPYITLAMMSCAHLSDNERETQMYLAQKRGAKIVVGTVGEAGSYVLYKNDILYASAVRAENIIDTMGAGDSYFSAFCATLLKKASNKSLICEDDIEMKLRIRKAMENGAAFAARVCSMEGAFGYGVPIEGRTEI